MLNRSTHIDLFSIIFGLVARVNGIHPPYPPHFKGSVVRLDFGRGFAYNYMTAHGGNPKGRWKTMASKKKATKKLKKAAPLLHVKPLILN